MDWKSLLYKIRYWNIIISSIGVSGISWGMLGAGVGRLFFDLEEEASLLWIALPIFIACIPFCIFILPKHLRKAGIL
jgi:hypothetical protein